MNLQKDLIAMSLLCTGNFFPKKSKKIPFSEKHEGRSYLHKIWFFAQKHEGRSNFCCFKNLKSYAMTHRFLKKSQKWVLFWVCILSFYFFKNPKKESISYNNSNKNSQKWHFLTKNVHQNSIFCHFCQEKMILSKARTNFSILYLSILKLLYSTKIHFTPQKLYFGSIFSQKEENISFWRKKFFSIFLKKMLPLHTKNEQ